MLKRTKILSAVAAFSVLGATAGFAADDPYAKDGEDHSGQTQQQTGQSQDPAKQDQAGQAQQQNGQQQRGKMNRRGRIDRTTPIASTNKRWSRSPSSRKTLPTSCSC